MNKKPVHYLQIDPRWKNKDYSAKGEKTTIGKSGCGPTCAAMLIETMTGQTFTPEDACKWALERGYKAPKQGTYYSYFMPQFAYFGIDCDQLSWANTYGKPNHKNHERAFELLKEGYYLIACMGKGLWTSSGHYVVVWWEDGFVRILDPASTAGIRLNSDLETFKSQVKYYWAVDARKFNEGDDDVEFSYEKFLEYQERYEKEKAELPPSDWSKDAREWAEGNGIINGDQNGNKQYKKPATREELTQILYNMKEGG